MYCDRREPTRRELAFQHDGTCPFCGHAVEDWQTAELVIVRGHDRVSHRDCYWKAVRRETHTPIAHQGPAPV